MPAYTPAQQRGLRAPHHVARLPRAPLALALSLGLLMTGCVVAPVQPRGVVYTQPAYVNTAPPPPQVEVVGVAPAPGYVWVSGYWVWQMNRYVWLTGHWTAPPHAGARWMPHAWFHEPGGWRLHEGRWEGR